MRAIKYIALHCTATQQNATIESIKRYWKEQLNWKNPGYHYLIKPCGQIVQLLDEDIPSNGVSGFNSVTVNICYIGGITPTGKPTDNRTANQKASILFLLEELKERYPRAIIQGHRDFPDVKKACPCFDARTEYRRVK